MTTTVPEQERLTPGRARELADELGLEPDEYERIRDTLGRVPTVSELGMYSVMWSEHCSYKSSRVHLAELPAGGPRVLVGPGGNAGVVDVGDGLAVAFKIESHNHPSFVEPEQGAATGVGGILRDVFTMGARPVAVLDPLRFGLVGDGSDDDDLQRHLVDGVVRGVGGYGNCVGVPNLGGETVFDDAYARNPLVNVLAVGVMPVERLQRATARRPGDLAVLLGSATGRDGIGGASVLASATFEEGGEDKRPTVQVGDPFAEKLLIECCLELYEHELVTGIQDMGAAGIACSTAEMASRAGTGMVVDLDAVHLREAGMESWEILCSESQERMLALVRPEDLDAVREVAARWDVSASVIGEVVEGDELELSRGGRVVARLPVRSLADEAPVYRRPVERPPAQDRLEALDAEAVAAPQDLADLCLRFLAWPNVASKRWVYGQYDQLVQSGTVLGPGMGDAGVLRLPDSRRALAVATDGHGRWCALDPREGARRVVAEACRNVACTGARPLAATDCLNFGSPERPAVMWQFTEVVAGLAEACRALEVPITGGNVSFYNETAARAIHPTPVVGVVGVLEDAERAVGLSFRERGDEVLLLGTPTTPGLAGGELRHFLGLPLGGRLPPVDLEAERALTDLLAAAASGGLLASAHDVSAGGLLVALAESCVAGGQGLVADLPDEPEPLQVLFSEAPGRVVVSVRPDHLDEVAGLARRRGVPLRRLGTVGGAGVVLEVGAASLELALDDVVQAFETGLPRVLEGPAG